MSTHVAVANSSLRILSEFMYAMSVCNPETNARQYLKGITMSIATLKARMKSNAEAVQAIVQEMTCLEDAFQYAGNLTRKQGGFTVAAAGFSPRAIEILHSFCMKADLRLLDPPLKPRVDQIHTAVTPVDWGIAETGTLVINSVSEDVRLATMLAETHIALLPASKILPNAEAIESILDETLKTDAAAYTAFITGASRTADIERVLAIGVHGPRELHILIMEENDA
jgi:L-lactate dehydrogenase complex protein LldG